MRQYYYKLILLCILLNTQIAGAQWITERSPTRENLNAISSNNKGHYWIVGNSGTILFRDNDGWKLCESPTSENLLGIDFINENDGWAVGENGTILHFNGLIWEKYSCPIKTDLLSVNFEDKNNGTAVGSLGTILVFNNGIWKVLKNGYKGNFQTVSYENNDIWIGGGLECVSFPIIKIQNVRDSVPTVKETGDSFVSIRSIYTLSSDNIWAAGSPSALLHFNGESWEQNSINERFSSLNHIFFSDENTGISVGLNGTILCFVNDNWVQEQSGVNVNLNSAITYNNIYFAIGNNGTIVSKNLDLISDHKIQNPENGLQIIQANTDSQYNEGEFIFVKLMPNPSDEILNINILSDSDLTEGRLIVTSVNGQLLVEESIGFIGNSFIYTLNTVTLKSGLYSLNLIFKEKSYKGMFVVDHPD